MESLAVLLSSYNGEKYIGCQLDSILHQTCRDRLHVFVRDDGSSDNTLEEIRRTGEVGGKITLLPSRNLGARASFCALLEFAKKLPPNFTHFAFADQDDRWDLDKLEIALAALGEAPSGSPVLYGSTSCLADENLHPIQKRQARKLKPITVYNSLIQCVVPGHTYVFNRKLLDLVPDGIQPSEVYYHDTFLLNLALLFGRLIYDPLPHTDYRQHPTTQMGVEKNFFKWLAIRFNRVRKGDSHQYARQIRYLYKLYADRMPHDVRHEIERFMDSQRNVLSRLGYALTTRFYRQKPLESLAFRFLYLWGGYKLEG